MPRVLKQVEFFALTRPEIPEANVQGAVLEFLRYAPTVAWAFRMNTGAAKFDKRDGSGQYFVRFGFPGMSDILGQMRTGQFLAIECKRRTGRKSDEQKAFIAMVRKHNGLAGFAKSIDDAQAILRGEIRD